ncbi:hypothetical protein [Symbioplanes lichenis]|uniref:hypothetical protein n=1 Tax=Symbioplanes lichenis TaxID=1629072 RepID=UPI002739DDBC|nr:hypothetical protein [Actinoplanes lichenis]
MKLRRLPVEPPPTIDAAWQFYTSARNELLQRVSGRDSTQFLFMAASATLFSVALSSKISQVLYAVPLLGLGVSQLYCHHTIIIGALGKYVGAELDRWLKENGSGSEIPPQWDNSEALLGLKQSHLRRILSSGYILIVVPEVLALAFAAVGHRFSAVDYAGLSLGAAAVAISVIIVSSAYRIRKVQLNDTARHVESTAVRPSPRTRIDDRR